MTKDKKDNSVAAGIAGAVIGAGAAIVTTQILSDKKTRNKINKTVAGLKKQVMNTINNTKGDVTENVEKKIEEGKKEVEEKIK